MSKTYGITAQLKLASTVTENLGIETDVLMKGTVAVRHNYMSHDTRGAVLVFKSDGQTCDRRRRNCACSDTINPSGSYNNTVMGNNLGIGFLGGCMRNTTIWDNGLGITGPAMGWCVAA